MIKRGIVLIVDDDSEVSASIEGFIGNFGYEVKSFNRGNDALLYLCSNDVDVVLTDIRMPEMDGIELLEKVLSIDTEIPVVLMTAYTDFDQVVTALKKGAFDFIHKPYEMKYLLKTLDKALAYRTMRASELNYKIDLERAITERTNELENAHKAIFQSEKMALVGQLAAGVAHEINNPVGYISSNLESMRKFMERLLEYISVLEESTANCCSAEELEKLEGLKSRLRIKRIKDDILSMVEESLEGVTRIKEIVRDLKHFSRMDESKFIFTDINETLERALAIVKNEIKYVATIVTDYGDIPKILCHPNQLAQVFINMLVNASHAITDKGEISVRTRNDENNIFVTISDSGCGMPDDVKNRIFDPFFTTKEVGKGTGLGLSISSEIVKKHNGEIIVESREGKGTSFIIKLPIIP